jgi:hypothetical protein
MAPSSYNPIIDLIKYSTENGTQIATHYHNGDKVTEKLLGRVIDRPNGIFYNKEEGYYKFTLQKGKESLSKKDQS